MHKTCFFCNVNETFKEIVNQKVIILVSFLLDVRHSLSYH